MRTIECSVASTGAGEAVVPHAVLIGGVGLLCLLALVVAGRRLARSRRARRLRHLSAALKSDTASAFIEVAIRPRATSASQRLAIPDADAAEACIRATASILYGDVAAAREALASIDWNRRAPGVHAAGLYDEALLAMLCTGEAERGLQLARRATGVRDASSKSIRARSRGSDRVDAWLLLGEVLCNVAQPQRLAQIEIDLAAGKQQLFERLLAARALSIAYARAGEPIRAAPFRRLLDTEAPSCRALHVELDAAGRLPAIASDGGSPSSAVLENAWPAPGESNGQRRLLLAAAGLVVVISILVLAMQTFGVGQ